MSLIKRVNDDQDISTLLEELSSFEMPLKTKNVSKHQSETLDEKDAMQYFLDKSKAIIEAGVNAVQDLTHTIVQGQDAREIEALSKLMTATAQTLDTLNRGALIDKKADRDEQLEMLKLEGKKQLAQLKGPQQHITNNNVLVASREEIMKKLFGKPTETIEI